MSSGTTVFVGGLSWNTDDNSLSNTFSKFGTLESTRVVLDRNTGRSKGFGFVTFSTKEEANEAVSKMNGAELDGRTIRCDYATERSEGGGGGGGRGNPYDRPRRDSGRGGYGGGYRSGGRDGYHGGRDGGGYGRDRDNGRNYRRDEH